jgi:hypothetical protein
LGRGECLDKEKSLGAIPSNQATILSPDYRKNNNGLLGESEQARTKYKGKAPATSYSSQDRLTALQRTGDSRAKDFGTEGNVSEMTGTSIFDPVLCEVAYRWFCPPGGLVVNPTAGESVYGIVAGYLGYAYQGVELRPEQISSNVEQAAAIGVTDNVSWIEGDGREVADLVTAPADFIMCCPPYYDLEIYSDHPDDLSVQDDYGEFLEMYREIVQGAVDCLKDDRFAMFTVGDIRDRAGHCRNFVSDTICAFLDAGCHLYNEAILVTAIGSLPIRAARPFTSGRKLGKTHQNVLIFVKGDWRKAVEACGHVEVAFPDALS